MIVVDTTVWVDFFRDAPTWQVAYLVDLVEADEAVCLTDVVLTEILQGLRSDADARRVERRLSAFDVLRLEDLDDFRRAAALYRQASAAGYTIRRTLDCLIASVCVREDAQLLHADADFDHLAACSPLAAVAAPPA